MQTIFLDTENFDKKQNNWKDILQHRAEYPSIVNITVQYK